MRAAPGTVIVGGGLAAQRCAQTLRRRGYEDPIRIVCAESEPPYDRPPLSKEALAREPEPGALAFRPPEWYAENEVELLLGARAEGLDPAARRLRLHGSGELGYEQLIIATGALARELPFLAGYENVRSLRTAADAARLRPWLEAGARVAIVGAGFIGQEVAATARRSGCEVTMIEALGVPLEPILGAALGAWFANLHEEEGVRVLLGTALAAAHGIGTMVEELELADGRRFGCDVVVVGIGTVPATAWLAGSGLDPAGVRTDTAGRTSLPGVYAAGDASIPFDPRFGLHERTEHWDAAAWQGAAVAKAITGQYPGTPPLPSFWSDQYGHRIQYVGHARRADGLLIEGDPYSRDFEVLFTRRGIPIAGLTVDRPRSVPALRKQIDCGPQERPAREVAA
jgi:3-phenylpropionate/trans-cinnamate dioxygenase ferredoxin reductase subunit